MQFKIVELIATQMHVWYTPQRISAKVGWIFGEPLSMKIGRNIDRIMVVGN